MSLGAPEIILIFLAILLLFGAKRIPEIARGLGKGIREFKDATNDIKNELTLDDSRQRIHQTRPPQYGTTAPRADSYAPQPAAEASRTAEPARPADAPPAAETTGSEQK